MYLCSEKRTLWVSEPFAWKVYGFVWGVPGFSQEPKHSVFKKVGKSGGLLERRDRFMRFWGAGRGHNKGKTYRGKTGGGRWGGGGGGRGRGGGGGWGEGGVGGVWVAGGVTKTVINF